MTRLLLELSALGAPDAELSYDIMLWSWDRMSKLE
jgi:hypothetical protein